MPEHRLTADRVRSLLDYDAACGTLTWREREVRETTARTDRTWNARYAGKVAGASHNAGYVRLSIDGGQYLAHRLIWLIATGVWPSVEVDHINGDRSDNRWVNLRLATASQNKMNSATRAGTITGLRGVRRSCGKDRYQSKITINGRTIYLGAFGTPTEARAAYEAAARTYFGEFARLA